MAYANICVERHTVEVVIISIGPKEKLKILYQRMYIYNLLDLNVRGICVSIILEKDKRQ